MKQMMDQNMNMEMANSTMGITKTESKGTMIGMICCSILAIAGIGFGVYEYLQANQTKQQIADLKVEIKNSDGSTTTLETDKIEVKDDTKTVVITDASDANEVAKHGVLDDEFIYFYEWGVKVKLQDDKIAGVLIDIKPSRYKIWGGEGSMPYEVDESFTLFRESNDNIAPQSLAYNQKVYQDEEYTYFLSRPNGTNYPYADEQIRKTTIAYSNDNAFLDASNWSKI